MQSEQLYRLTTQAEFQTDIAPGYVAIPQAAVNDPRLNGDPIGILSVACSLSQNGEDFFSFHTIQQQSFFNPRRLQQAIQCLINAGYLEEVSQ